MTWPRWGAEQTVKHGRLQTGQAQRRGKDCRRQVVPGARKQVISPKTWARMDTLRRAKIPLAGISEKYLQEYGNRT